MEPIFAVLLLSFGVAVFAALWTFSSVLTLQRELRQLQAEVHSLHAKRAKQAQTAIPSGEILSGAIPSGATPSAAAPRDAAPTDVPEPALPVSQAVPPGLAALGVEADAPAATPKKTTEPAPVQRPIAPRPRATTPPKPAEPPFDWERLLGIRGAAVVGGIALVLAGIFFVQVAIERGWLGPAARDLLALTVGAACLAMHAPLRRRGMLALADSVGGAGTVLIYGASWAAARLHGLVSTPLAYAVMTATTGLALFLAVKTKAPIVAAFALVGGFATPLLLDTVDSDSVGIFGYVLVLNGVLLAFGRIRRWTWAWPMAAIGACAVLIAWLKDFGGNTNVWLASMAVGAVIAGFLVSPPPSNSGRPSTEDPQLVRISCGLSYALVIGTALACILFIGGQAPNGNGLWPVAIFAAMLLSAATIADKGIQAFLFFPGSCIAAVFVLVSTLFGESNFEGARGTIATGTAFQTWTVVSACLGGLIAVLCLAVRRGAPALAYGLTGLALLRTATFAGRVEDTAAFTPAMAIFVLLGLFGASRVKGSSVWGAATGLLCGLMLCLQVAGVMGHDLRADSLLPWTAAGLAAAAALTGLAIRKDTPLRKTLTGFALWAPLPIVALTLEARPNLAALQLAAGAVAAASLAAATAARPSKGAIQAALVSAAGSAAVLWVWSMDAQVAGIQSAPWAHATAAAALVLAPLAVLVAITPKLRRHGEWLAWTAVLPAGAAAVGPAAFQVENAAKSIAGWHVTLGTLATMILVAAGLLHLRSRSSRLQAARGFPVWMTLIGLATAILAVSASRAFAAQWHLVATALGGGLVAYFTLRARSPQPGAAASIVAAWAAALLVGLTFLGRAFLAEPFYLPIELSIDYGMTALGVLLAYAGSRHLKQESELRRHIANATVAFLLILAFSWTNAAVLNRFTQDGHIRIDPTRLQNRDLAISMAWTAFAALTLSAGMWRRNLALRWTSLGLLVATIFKVFLYDLGALEGLSRVGSFLGLSVALLGVSVAYSRLLRTPEPTAGPG